MSGPPPDPYALRRDRRDDRGGFTTLSAAVREGPAPLWPLSRPAGREAALWEALWHKPQAAVWAVNRQEIEVALHVRCLASAEKPDARITLRQLVLRQMDSLGLTVKGLRANRWLIEAPDPTPRRAPLPSTPERESAKARMRRLDGGAA